MFMYLLAVLIKREYYFNMIQEFLKGMVHAKSIDVFQQSYFDAIKAVGHHTKSLEALEKFHKEKDGYAQYILDMIPGTRGKHGSSASESNHSSVLVYLNDGDKYINTHCEQPITLVKDLFKRQQPSISNGIWTCNKTKIRTPPPTTDKGR